MASFVEMATLRLVDETTGPLNKIQAQLRQFNAFAKGLASTKIDIGVTATGVSKVMVELRRLEALTKRLNATPVVIKTSTSNVVQPRPARGNLGPGQQAAAYGPQGAPVVPVVAAPKTTAVGKPVPAKGAADQPLTKSGLNDVINTKFRSALGYILITRLTINIANAILQNAKEGAIAKDVADSRITRNQLTPTKEAVLQANVDKQVMADRDSPSHTGLGSVSTEAIAAELLPIFQKNDGRPDLEANANMLSQIIRMALIEISNNKDPKEAIAGGIDYAKAAEATGQLSYTDGPKAGQYDPVKGEKFFGSLRGIATAIGQEFDAVFARRAIKYLGTSKMALNERGLGLAMLMNEENGTRASVGLRALIKSLDGGVYIKQNQAEQERLGLKAGPLPRNKKGQIIAAGGAIDTELLWTDPSAWIDKYLMPALKKDGVDTNDPVAVARAMSKLTSSGTGADSEANVALRIKQFMMQLDAIDRLDTSPATTDDQLKDSTLVKVAGVELNTEALFGETAQKIEGVTSPILDAVNRLLAWTSVEVKNASPENITTGGTVAVLLGALGFGAKKVFDATTSPAGQAIALGLNTIAEGVNTEALGLNTAALLGTAVTKGAIPAVVTGAGAGAAGAAAAGAGAAAGLVPKGAGVLKNTLRVAGPLGLALMVDEAAVGTINYIFGTNEPTVLDKLVGTLAPVVDDPSKVYPPKGMYNVDGRRVNDGQPVPVTIVDADGEKKPPSSKADYLNSLRSDAGVSPYERITRALPSTATSAPPNRIGGDIGVTEPFPLLRAEPFPLLQPGPLPLLQAEPFPLLRVDWSGMPEFLQTGAAPGKPANRGNTGLGSAAPPPVRASGPVQSPAARNGF